MSSVLDSSSAVGAASPYRKLQPRWCGLSKEQITEDQRHRIYRAMVEIVSHRGYQATTIKSVCALAGVSRQTFYDLFAFGQRNPKEICFLEAYDFVVDRAVTRISEAYRGERDPDRRLCRAFEQFAIEAAGEPQAARFALIEAFGAGPVALQRMGEGRAIFEGLIEASVNNRSGGATLSPRIAKGIAGGVERIARVYLLEGRIDRLSATADELSAWVSSYRPWSRPAPALTARAWRARPPAVRGNDEGLRILRAAATIAASEGYSALSAPRISRVAEVSEETFASMYDGSRAVEKCFLTAFDLLGVEALVCAAKAARRGAEWPQEVRDGIAALLDHIASNPFVGQVVFVEIFAVGPVAVEPRSKLLRRFANVFIRRIPEEQRPSELLAEAIVGAVWAVIHDYVARGRVHLLRDLAEDASYLALTPIIGSEAAIEAILAG